MPTIHYCREKWILRLSFNIAERTTALSHLGKQVIAISIIHRSIQWPGPQTILTSRLTEINGVARKQSDPPLPPSTLHLFLLSAPPIICLPLHSDIISAPPPPPPPTTAAAAAAFPQLFSFAKICFHLSGLLPPFVSQNHEGVLGHEAEW